MDEVCHYGEAVSTFSNDYQCLTQPITDKDGRDQAESDNVAENAALQETLMISKLSRDQRTIETVIIDRYADSSFWKRLRKRLCSSHRFKNLQVGVLWNHIVLLYIVYYSILHL